MLDVFHNDVVWNISDTGWAKAGYSSLFATWLRGACVFAHQTSRFDAGEFLEVHILTHTVVANISPLLECQSLILKCFVSQVYYKQG